MNIPLLRKIQDKARKYPRSIQMGWWADPADKNKSHPCGTVACIAGTAVLLTKPDLVQKFIECERIGRDAPSLELAGQKALRLTEIQASTLFMPWNWPKDFYERLERVPSGTKAYSEVFCNRIDHFIKTNGAE